MINHNALETVHHAYCADLAGVVPQYRSYCFDGVPWSIERILTAANTDHPGLPRDCFPQIDGIRQVVLLFIDGFGWKQWERFAETLNFLTRFAYDGTVSKLTSMFPSTTCAHVTCVHSGLSPSESGLYEWFQYEPTLDAMIAPLLFSFAGEHRRDGLCEVGAEPEMFFPHTTIHQRLAAARVDSIYITPDAFTPSPFNNVACQGGHAIPYKSLGDGLCKLTDVMESPIEHRRYVHYYYGNVDLASHQSGPSSPHTADVIERLFRALENELIAKLTPRNDTLICLVADHGMAEVTPETALYLNELEPSIVDALAKDVRGQPLAPAGSPRDLFLHFPESAVDHWVSRLSDRLSEVARVYATETLIDRKLFGPTPASPAFRQRVGNVVVLPHEDETVWWFEPDKYSVKHHGEHGGLSASEMEIPFLALRV